MAYSMNVDYAAAIANTSDPAEKASLEASRNEKIAAMNASGTNTGGYTATNDGGTSLTQSVQSKAATDSGYANYVATVNNGTSVGSSSGSSSNNSGTSTTGSGTSTTGSGTSTTGNTSSSSSKNTSTYTPQGTYNDSDMFNDTSNVGQYYSTIVKDSQTKWQSDEAQKQTLLQQGYSTDSSEYQALVADQASLHTTAENARYNYSLAVGLTDANGNAGYYSGGLDGSDLIWTPITQKKTETTSTDSTPTYSASEREYTQSERPNYNLPTMQETYDNQKNMLDAWQTAANQQAVNTIDNSTQQGIIDYQRTLQDANDSYASELASIAKDEKNAQDNSALYAELRGDKGGIGQAQYNEIAATAMANRQGVQTAQNELATDTQRAITDLRAQGEYEKADKLLEISQTYLSQLQSIYQWAVEYGLSQAQFEESIREWQDNFNESLYEFDANLQYQYDNLNESIREWTAEFEESVREFNATNALNEASVTGYYNGTPTYQRESDTNDTLASTGSALLSAGIIPSTEQLNAMGMTVTEAQAYITAAASSSGSGSGSGSGLTGDNTLTAAIASLDSLIASGSINSYDQAYSYLKDLDVSTSDIQNSIGKSEDWSAYKTQTLAHAQYTNSVNTIVNDVSTPLSQYINALVDQTKSYGENYGGAAGIIAMAQQWAATYALQHNGNESLVEDAINNIDWASLKSQVSAALQ